MKKATFKKLEDYLDNISLVNCGNLHVNYDDLVECFGEPNFLEFDETDCVVQWNVELNDGSIVSIESLSFEKNNHDYVKNMQWPLFSNTNQSEHLLDQTHALIYKSQGECYTSATDTHEQVENPYYV